MGEGCVAADRDGLTYCRHCPASPGDPVRRGLSIQSLMPLEYLVARSSRAMTTEYDFAFSRRIAPEVCWKFAPSENRGRREDRVRAAPAVSCATCTRTRTRAYRFSGEHPAFPAQWLYGLYVIVLVTGFLATIIPEKRLLLLNLTPAPGRQTHTTSPYAWAMLVSHDPSVHRIPPHVRDDRDRPSHRVRQAERNH